MALTDEQRLEHYRKRAQERENRRTQDGEKSYEKVKRFQFKEGPNRIRIIPPIGDRLDFYVEVEKTWQAGPTWKGPIVRQRQFGNPDVVSDYIAKLETSEHEDDRARAGAIKKNTSKTIECFIIDRNAPQEGPQLCALNWTVYNEIMALFADSEYGDITHAETGTDLKVTYTPGKRGAGGKWVKKPEHSVMPARNQSPLDYPEALEEDLFDKYQVLKPTDNDFALAILEGREQEFIAEQKAAREAGEEQDDEPAPLNPPPTSATDEAVRAELERIKNPPKPPKASGTPKAALTASYWIVEDGETVAATGDRVQELVNQGQLDLSCIKQGDSEWATPKAYGFVPQKSKVGIDMSEVPF